MEGSFTEEELLRSFHGQLHHTKATDLLQDKPRGTFLYRESSQGNGLLTVSFKAKEKVSHIRVAVSEVPNGKEYSTSSKDRSPLVPPSLYALLLSSSDLRYPLARSPSADVSSPPSTTGLSSPSPFLFEVGGEYGVLPAEIMLLILQHLGCAKTLCNFSRVCIPVLLRENSFTLVIPDQHLHVSSLCRRFSGKLILPRFTTHSRKNTSGGPYTLLDLAHGFQSTSTRKRMSIGKSNTCSNMLWYTPLLFLYFRN